MECTDTRRFSSRFRFLLFDSNTNNQQQQGALFLAVVPVDGQQSCLAKHLLLISASWNSFISPSRSASKVLAVLVK